MIEGLLHRPFLNRPPAPAVLRHLFSLPQPHPRPSILHLSIGEKGEAGSFEGCPNSVKRARLRVRTPFYPRDGVRGHACLLGEFAHPPAERRASHPDLNSLHLYHVQINVDTAPMRDHDLDMVQMK